MMQNKRFRAFFARNSLRTQLLFRSLLILIVVMILIGLLQYVLMRDVIYQNKASSLQSQVMSIPMPAWQEFLNSGTIQGPGFFIPEANLAFIDADGNFSKVPMELADGDRHPPKLSIKAYQDALNGNKRPGFQIVQDDSGQEQLVVLHRISTRDGQTLGIVQISTLTTPLKELLVRQLFVFFFLALVFVLVGGFFFLPVIRKTLVPLFNMVKTTEQIDAGNLTQRFPTNQGQLEIDRLSGSFNGMLDRLETSFEAERAMKEQMRRFVGDASHELRTPLTSIYGFLEVLLRGAVHQPDQLEKALRSMHSEAKRLNELVADLLLLTKLDRTPAIELQPGKLASLIQDMEPQLRILADQRTIKLDLETNLVCLLNEDKIKQVVLNLFHNAVQHTDPQTGQIEISLKAQNQDVELAVKDNGYGISEAHLAHIFDRFYRSESSRTRKFGGAGLGLAITKSIVEAHKGTIRVESEEGEGSTFTVWIPLAEQPINK